MMHFKMISKRIASPPREQVNQCLRANQPNAWNDIRGVGLGKHHDHQISDAHHEGTVETNRDLDEEGGGR